MKKVDAIRDRLDAMATDALEHLIEDAEKKDDIRVTDVKVEIAPGLPCGSPTLDVSVTVERV